MQYCVVGEYSLKTWRLNFLGKRTFPNDLQEILSVGNTFRIEKQKDRFTVQT